MVQILDYPPPLQPTNSYPPYNNLHNETRGWRLKLNFPLYLANRLQRQIYITQFFAVSRNFQLITIQTILGNSDSLNSIVIRQFNERLVLFFFEESSCYLIFFNSILVSSSHKEYLDNPREPYTTQPGSQDI